MAPPSSPRKAVDYLAKMDSWPASWAGDDQDLPIGQSFVAIMHPFMEHLVQQNLATPTLRRHLNALWLIGGETIRMLHLDPAMRSEPPLDLLQTTVAGGEGPWVADLTDAEQNALDATARKLQRFLVQIDP